MASRRRKSQLFLFELPTRELVFLEEFTQDGSFNLRDPDFSIGIILQFLGSCGSFCLISD